MKRQIKKLLYLLLAVMLMATAVLGLAGPASATTETLSQLSPGDTVSFAGYQWIILNNGASSSNGAYLLMDGYYEGSTHFSTNYSNDFSGSSIQNLLDGSSGFYGSLSSADKALVLSHGWSLADDSGGTGYGNVSDYVGLLSLSDYNNYNSIIGQYTNTGLPYVFWMLTPGSETEGTQGDVYIYWTYTNSTNTFGPNSTYSVCPALYLSSDSLVSGGNGGTVLTTTTAPTVTSPTDTSITSTSATLGGDVTSDGGASISKRGILYSLTSVNANPTLGGTGVTEVDDSSASTGTFSEAVTGLTPSSAYSFVAFATNSVGTAYTSPVSSFNTWSDTTSMTSTENPAAFGQSVTFTATVAASPMGSGTPTGMVTFYDNNVFLGTGTLNEATPDQATFTTSSLAVGNHNITASYEGDSSFNTSTGSLTGNPEVINKATPAPSASANPVSTAYGNTVTLSVYDLPSGATGSVVFSVYGSTPDTGQIFSSSGTVSSGSASCTTGVLAPGSYSVTATYSGDSNYLDASATTSFTVVPDHDATLSNLEYNNTPVSGFISTNYAYDVTLPPGTTKIPTVSATVYDNNASEQITQAIGLPGSATVVVTAQDNTAQLTYTINFSVAPPAQGLAVNPPGCTHTGPLSVTISDSSPLSVWQSVYYSTTGNPETVSGATYLNRSLLPHLFTLSVSDTVYARVYDISAGWGSLAFETYAIQTPEPVIDTPVYAGATSVSGTAADNANIGLIINGGTTVYPATADGSGNWAVSGLPALAAGESIVVTATGQGESPSQTATATVQAVPSSGGGGGSTTQPVNNNGTATLNPSTGGTVWLGSNVSVTIPKNALQGTSNVNVTIQQEPSPPATPPGDSVLSGSYGLTMNSQNTFTINGSLTLTLTFDPSSLKTGQQPAVFSYDTTTGQWVNLGGTVSGNTISVSVSSLGVFTVMAPPPVMGLIFTDVPASCWAYTAIENLAGLGYVSGYPDGTFKPGNPINRAELVTIMDKVLKLPAYNPQMPTFTDVRPGDWFDQTVESAVYVRIAKGYSDDTFRPDSNITRQELACVLVQALGQQDEAMADMTAKTNFTDDARISPWARGFVVVAVKDGLLKGYPDGSFQPQGDATRAEACAMVENFLNYSPGK
jgi:hypothetical protein